MEAGSPPGAQAEGMDSLEVTVRSMSGAEHPILLPRDATVFDLRKAIEIQDLCPMPCQRLLSGEKELNDPHQKIEELESLEILLVVGVSHGLCEIYLRTGDVLDYICLKRRDGITSECGAKNGSEREPFLLAPHEYITEVSWREDGYHGANCVKGVSFITNTGRTSGVYGHTGERWKTETAPLGQQITGLEMRTDHRGFVGSIGSVLTE